MIEEQNRLPYLGDPEALAFDVGAFEDAALDSRVQPLDVVAVDDLRAGIVGRLLEERYVRAQTTDVLVDLQEDFVVLEIGLPLAVRTDAEWMVGQDTVPI